MKKALKVTFGTILAAALSSTVWANEGDILQRGAVWVTGTYTESSNNGVSYGDLVQGATLGTSDREKRHVFIDPDGEWDYAVGFSYHIPNSRTRFFVSYDHFTDENESTNNTIRNLGRVPTPAAPTSARANVTNHADEFRIGLMHTLGLTPCFHLDVSGFIEWDEVKRDMNEVITGGGSTLPAARNTYNKVQGWGPGVGARAHTSPFPCYPNVGFFMGANTSLIWGQNTFEASLWDGAAAPTAALVYQYDPETSESVVGKLDISFGLDYKYCCKESGLLVDIALGLRYLNMYNVFKNGNVYENPVYIGSNDFAYAANLGSPNDWGRIGPFLTFAIGGAKA